MPSNSAKIASNSKNLPFLESLDSCKSEFVIEKFKIGDFFMSLWHNPHDCSISHQGSLYDPRRGPNGAFGRWVNLNQYLWTFGHLMRP